MGRPERTSEIEHGAEPTDDADNRPNHRKTKKPFQTWLPDGASDQIRDLVDELRYRERDRSISTQALVVEAINLLMAKYNYPLIEGRGPDSGPETPTA